MNNATTSYFKSGPRSNLVKCLTMFVAIALINGCASHIQLQDNIRGSLTSVSISKEIRFLTKIRIESRAPIIPFGGAIGGAIAGAVAAIQSGKASEKAKTIDEITRECISNHLYDKFADSLIKTNFFGEVETTNEDQADAKFILWVSTYGFWEPGIFSDKRKPMLCVGGELILSPPFEEEISEKGKFIVKNPQKHPTIWRDWACVYSMTEGTPAYKLETYRENREKIREAFAKATDVVIEKLIQDFVKEKSKR